MDFWGALRVVRRRWYIALPTLVLSLALAAVAYLSVPTKYESSGNIVLNSPSAGGKVTSNPQDRVKINPLLAFDSSLITVTQILMQILNDPQTHAQLGAGPGSKSTYTASLGDSNGPFLFVVATSDSPTASRELVGKVLDRAKNELADRQRRLGAPDSTFITAEVLVAPTEAQAQIGGKTRFGGAALVVGLIVTAAATFGAESVVQALRRRRARSTVDTPVAEEPLHRNGKGETTARIVGVQAGDVWVDPSSSRHA